MVEFFKDMFEEVKKLLKKVFFWFFKKKDTGRVVRSEDFGTDDSVSNERPVSAPKTRAKSRLSNPRSKGGGGGEPAKPRSISEFP